MGPLRAELGCLEAQVETSEGKVSLIGAFGNQVGRSEDGRSLIYLAL